MLCRSLQTPPLQTLGYAPRNSNSGFKIRRLPCGARRSRGRIFALDRFGVGHGTEVEVFSVLRDVQESLETLQQL